MNSLIAWDPWNELDEMSHRLLGRSKANGTWAASRFLPAVDISEDDKQYTLTMDLPEMDKESIRVVVEGGNLIVSGERKAPEASENRKIHRQERSFGQFQRSFALPEDAVGHNVEAELKNGVLKLLLPKSEAALPKQIEVKIS